MIVTFLTIGILNCLAEDLELIVYRLRGKVLMLDGDKSEIPVLGQNISYENNIEVGEDGMIELVDIENAQRICIYKSGSGTIRMLAAKEGNFVTPVSRNYLDYIKKQIGNKGKPIVSRKKENLPSGTQDNYSGTSIDSKSIIEEFASFRKSAHEDFNDFRNKVLKEYADFVRNPWEDVALQPAEEKPKEEDMEDVKPFVIDSNVNPIVPNFDENDKGTKPVTIIDILPTPRPLTYPEPVVPVEEDNGENESGEEKEGNDNEHYFNFFGTKMKCQWSNDCRFSLKGYDENAIADGIELLSTEKYSTLLVDCIRLRKEYHLSDWAYILMLRDLCNSICGEDTNESTLMQAFLYSQSGYKMRLALAGPKLKMMVATQFDIYGHSYYSIDGSNYYILDGEYDRVHICKAHVPKEQEMSLVMKDSPRLAFAGTETRMIGSRPYPDLKAEIGVNQNLMDFYSTYPTSECNHNVMTRWAMYANMEMDQGVRDQLYPQIRAMIEGKTQRKAAESILNWIQTAFPYEYDDKVWGRDRAFFAEESLYYPFCDCEDRSILFTRLIRDLLDLKCILIFYPGHLATGVQFTEDGKGDYIDIDGERFTICDPTIMGDGAPVGFTMPGMDNSSAKVIILD